MNKIKYILTLVLIILSTAIYGQEVIDHQVTYKVPPIVSEIKVGTTNMFETLISISNAVDVLQTQTNTPVMFVANKAGVHQPGLTRSVRNKISMTNIVLNIGGCYNATDSMFVAPITGYYRFEATLQGDTQPPVVYFYINGTNVSADSTMGHGFTYNGAGASISSMGYKPSPIVYMTNGMYAEIYVGNTTNVNGNITNTYWQGWKLY